MEGAPGAMTVRVEELDGDTVEEWSDGSRMAGRAAAATKTEARYLGTLATIAGTEELGMSMAWDRGDMVLGSTGQSGSDTVDMGVDVPSTRSW